MSDNLPTPITGSLIGGIPETQEVLDFGGQTKILPDCEMIRLEEINMASKRMEWSDVRYWFVIDRDSTAEGAPRIALKLLRKNTDATGLALSILINGRSS